MTIEFAGVSEKRLISQIDQPCSYSFVAKLLFHSQIGSHPQGHLVPAEKIEGYATNDLIIPLRDDEVIPAYLIFACPATLPQIRPQYFHVLPFARIWESLHQYVMELFHCIAVGFCNLNVFYDH